MAKTSTITITYGGEPLAEAEVFSTGTDTVLVTDANGHLTSDFPDDYATVLLMAIRHDSFPMEAYVALCILEAGEDYTLAIPTYALDESGGELRGIHCHFATKD